MSTGYFLNIQPAELKFPFELKKQCLSSIRLTNKTDRYIAFKVKTTNREKYCVRPNVGIVLPGTSCEVTVTMQAQKEALPDMHCRDKFLVQSVLAPEGASNEDITSEMFKKDTGQIVQEFKLRVIYIPANPPSPVPEGSEEGTTSRASTPEKGHKSVSFEDVSRSLEKTKEKSSEVSKLTDEKAFALQQNRRLLQELEALRSENRKYGAGFSVTSLVVVGVTCLLIGYLIKYLSSQKSV